MLEQNKRILDNTVSLYIRSFVTLLISLYSSRLILQALGAEDFGIYNVVGGFVSMFWLVSSMMSSAVVRFLNVEMGHGDQQALNEVFSLSLNVLIILSFFTIILVESGGIWYITQKMNIPDGRMEAALWIFQLSVFNLIVGFVTIPFDAAIIAHEKMRVYAILNVIESVIKLFIALFLIYGKTEKDLLIVYAILLAINTFFVRFSIFLYSRTHFEECRFRFIFHVKKLREMLSFAWWNFIASITGTFSGQGVNMVLNYFYGPILNTSRGIANTVTNAVSQVVYNVSLAIKPQITQSLAAGETERTKTLVYKGTRFSSYLMLLFIIPLLLEMPFILHLWLGQYPDYTVVFVRLSLLSAFQYVLDSQFYTAKMAAGKIKRYQIIVSVLTFLTFPFSYILLKMGLSPIYIYIIPLFLTTFKIVVSLVSTKDCLGFTMFEVIRDIYLNITLVGVCSSALPLLFHFVLPYGWLRFFVVLFISLLCTCLSILFTGCSKEEREQVVQFARESVRKRR